MRARERMEIVYGPGPFGPALGGADRQRATAHASDLERLTRNAQASITILERRLHAAHGVLVRMRESIKDCEKNKAHGHAAALKDHADDLARALEAT